ncbi:MAG: phosphoribosyltransferase [Gemmatimonadota bacterium]|nr:phosphoribosyltransferase [Gemmatimonadota bacterium]
MRSPWPSDRGDLLGPRFVDRHDAGRQLAEHLRAYAHEPGLIVLGLPRGGVPVAYEVARALGAPLDVFVVRKLGVPGHEEYAMGAIASGGIRVVNQEAMRQLQLTAADLDRVERDERRELERRDRLYRGDRPHADLAGRTVLLVDDGLATGSTMLAAVEAARTRGPRRIIVAAPVAPPDTREAIRRAADDCVCVHTPDPFYGVGVWYADFDQTTDEEVQRLLAAVAEPPAPAGAER